MKKKYHIVLDLDDTLMNSEKKISKYSKEILKECQQKFGCKLIISTARSFERSIESANEINADFICCFNGNFIYDNEEKRTIYDNPIDTEISKKIIDEIVEKTDVENIISEGLNTSYCTNKKYTEFVDSIYAPIEQVKIMQCYKLIIHCKTEKYFSQIKKLVEKYNLSINLTRQKNAIRILPKGTDKWNAIEKIKSLPHNDEYKIIAFGDDITDKKTLENADVGVRMQNSISELENIDFCAESNNNNGVAKFLYDYFNLENK